MAGSDIINASFEAYGAWCAYRNIRALLRDKVVKGISVGSIAFFTSWGFWNLYYYPSLGQWFSFTSGAALAAGNLIWVVLACYYARRRGHHGKCKTG